MVRRALACDQAALIDFHLSMSWVDKLFHSMQRMVPEGYLPPTLSHILIAGRELVTMLAEATRRGIVAPAAMPRPLDAALTLTNAELALYLMPTKRTGSAGSVTAAPDASRVLHKGKGKVQKVPKAKEKASPKGKGKGKPRKCWKFHAPFG